jgi:hypothetical protein
MSRQRGKSGGQQGFSNLPRLKPGAVCRITDGTKFRSDRPAKEAPHAEL